MAYTEALALTVNYDLGVAEAVAAGNYGYANPDITAEHFPDTRDASPPEAVLVHFDFPISSKDALAELDKMGLRAGELAELLAFGASYPNKQRQFPIVALGSTWRYPGGFRYVPFLDHWHGRRRLDLSWFGFGWYEYCRFLAFRKDDINP